MTTVHFIRHGQAGQRDDYDRLSDTGRLQAALLGEHLCREGVRFDLAVIGGLRRQRETAEIVLEKLAAAGLAPAEIRQDEQWNEFDLDAVFAGIVPQIAAEDDEFRLAMEEIERQIRAGDGRIHRVWTPTDSRVVDAWIEGRYTFDGESWAGFNRRVLSAAEELRRNGNGRRIAVFSSAAPISIVIASIFGSSNPAHIMGLAGASINSNVSILAWRGSETYLGCYNAVAHLGDPALRTFR
ncbi:MAG: histidine phosphatase family protein [Acidobacteria bacterium]|nr:histidine phosphatase family protein [Acidobacteriota bacterium]